MFNWLLDGKKMTAQRREEALSAYLDGELSQRERAEVEGALARDPTLRAELEEMRQVVGLMKAVPQVPLPRSFTLDPAVYGRTRQPWLQLYPALRTATVLATLVFVFLFAGNLVVNIAGMASEPAPETQRAAMRAAETTVVESEKVEVTSEVEASPPETAASVAAEGMVEEAPAPTAQEVAPSPQREAQLQGEGVAQVTGTEAATAESAEPAEPPAAAAITGESVAEQTEEPNAEPTGEAPKLMAVPPTAAAEGGGERDSTVLVPGTATPAGEPTVEAYGLEAPQATPEATPQTARQEVVPRGAEELTEGTDWVLIAEIGLGALAAVLLVLTLLARHYRW
jgi:anti-sigma factor RsiW